MRVLLIKLSSMGDVIHTLPALTDAQQAIPEIKFTWLVEEGFAEIPAWHSAVAQVIPVKMRGRDLRQVWTAIKQLRAQKFDLVLDAQGLIKSALLARLTGAKQIAGLAYRSCREPVASFLYNKTYVVEKNQHAIDRVRQLFAQALHYSTPNTVASYNLAVQKNSQAYPYVFFLHGTTWDSKHWPEAYWLQLIDLVTAHGYKVKVTWATPEQRQRAQKFADYSEDVIMLPHLTIAEAAVELNNASGVVAVDTGFAHLAAALDKPVIALFGSTDIRKSGAQGINSLNLQSKFSCAPCMQRTCSFTGASSVQPACMQELAPQKVWQLLQQSWGPSKDL